MGWLSASPLAFSGVSCLGGCQWLGSSAPPAIGTLTNARQFQAAARATLSVEAYEFLAGGADDLRTMHRNQQAFEQIQIRARRLVDVSEVDTSVTLFGRRQTSPILLAPMGSQGQWHEQAELATAAGASRADHQMIVSTLSSFPIGEIAAVSAQPLWFQLYPTTDRTITRRLIERAEEASCDVLVLTVDTPVVGNRESQIGFLKRLLETGEERLGNLDDLKPLPAPITPDLDWSIVAWLREHTKLPIVLKGIVTHEDAKLCLDHGVDGVIISNHGGRQEESDRSTIECLPEVAETVAGRIPVLMDGGVMRGTDVFKAIALGADAVCVGRAYGYGLAAYGDAGVEAVLTLLQAELVRIMQLAGAVDLSSIVPGHVIGFR